MWWPRRALFGCAALKSAHPSSRQTVPRRCLRKGPKSGLVLVFLDRIAVDMSKERARGVRLDGDHLVGPVVELDEHNAIDLVPAPCLAAHLCKQTIRGIAAEGQTEAL